MRATLEFNLPDDADAHRHALDGAAWAEVCRELDEWLRQQIKYHNHTTYIAVRAHLRETVLEAGLDLDARESP